MPHTHLRWAQGGEAVVVSLAGEAITLRSTTSSPPGSRIDGTLTEGPPAMLRLKVHNCRRQADGAFLLDGRLINLTRELRERLSPAGPAPGPAAADDGAGPSSTDADG